MRKGMHIQKSSHHTTSAAPIRLQRSLRKVSRALYAVLCITLPLLKPTMIYVLTMLIVEGYRTFGESYVFWKESTPGNLGLTIVRYLYQQAFTSGNLGFGSAIGFALLFIVLIINLVQMKLMGLFEKE